MSFINKIKNQLTLTPKKDYQLEFDICMKCGKRMPDRNHSTLKKHQEANHKEPKQKKITIFIQGHPLIFVLIIVLPFFGLIAYGLPLLLDEIQPIFSDVTILNTEQVEQCRNDVKNLKHIIYMQDGFTSAEVDELDRLLHECNTTFGSSRMGGTIFENEEYAELPTEGE